MQFSNYSDFRTAVLKLIDGDDVSASFSVETLDLLIGMGETRVYHDLRASTMVTPLSVAVSSNAAALPADLIELKEAYFSGDKPLDIVPLDRLRALEADGVLTGATPRYAAQDGDTLRFWPTASGTVLGNYYKRPADMKSDTWANQTTLARYPELFLFASLIESSPFIGEDQRIPIWETKYGQALEVARQNERMRVYGGGPLRIRTR